MFASIQHASRILALRIERGAINRQHERLMSKHSVLHDALDAAERDGQTLEVCRLRIEIDEMYDDLDRLYEASEQNAFEMRLA